MGTKRKQFDAALKARAALAALKEDKTISEVASDYEVHPNMISKWKRFVLTELPQLFSERPSQNVADAEVRETRLYEQIGRQKVELEWLKKSCQLGLEARRMLIALEHLRALKIIRQRNATCCGVPCEDSHFSSVVRSSGSNAIAKLVFGMNESVTIVKKSVKLLKGHYTSSTAGSRTGT